METSNIEPAILMLAGRGYSSSIVARSLLDNFKNVVIVLEDNPPLRSVVKSRIRRFGVSTTVGQVLFRLNMPLLRLKSRKRITALQNSLGTGFDLNDPRVINVKTVNCERVRQLIRDSQPSVVVINGTRIIRNSVLECAPLFVNMHAGITPQYRGVHGGYWAMVNGDVSKFGTTIHLVDKGVDTGTVLSQARATPVPEDCFPTYSLLQLKIGLPVLLKIVGELAESKGASGTQLEHSTGSESELDSKQWFHPTLWGYLWNGIAKRAW